MCTIVTVDAHDDSCYLLIPVYCYAENILGGRKSLSIYLSRYLGIDSADLSRVPPPLPPVPIAVDDTHLVIRKQCTRSNIIWADCTEAFVATGTKRKTIRPLRYLSPATRVTRYRIPGARPRCRSPRRSPVLHLP